MRHTREMSCVILGRCHASYLEATDDLLGDGFLCICLVNVIDG